MLHIGAVQSGTNLGNQFVTHVTLDAVQARLDQAVCGKALVDFFEYRGLQALLADGNHRIEMVGLGAEFALLYGSQF